MAVDRDRVLQAGDAQDLLGSERVRARRPNQLYRSDTVVACSWEQTSNEAFESPRSGCARMTCTQLVHHPGGPNSLKRARMFEPSVW